MYKKLFNVVSNQALCRRRQTSKHHLIIVDGPSAIAISKQLLEKSGTTNIRCLASLHYLALVGSGEAILKKQMVGWYYAGLLSALKLYLTARLNKQTDTEKLSACMNRVAICDYIHQHAEQILSVIVFNERNTPPALAVTTAKNKAIATACIQHGAVVENYFPIQVDYYYTWSEYYSQLLRSRAPALKPISVGRLTYTAAEATDMAKQNKPLLVLQPANVSINEEDLLLHFKRVIDVCYQCFDAITLRPHPSDNILAEIIRHIGDRSYTIDSGSLVQALSSHQYTVSLYSTVLYEAPLYGSVPVQYLEPHLTSELMQRCELFSDNVTQLQEIFNNLADANQFAVCLQQAKDYSATRMQIGSYEALLHALKQRQSCAV